MNGYLVTADDLNCQRDTVKAIAKGKADHLLIVKDNQETLKKEIDYAQDTGFFVKRSFKKTICIVNLVRC
jgi:ribosomal protein L30E